MCVKQSGEGVVAEGSMSPAVFGALAPAFPHLEALVLNGVGESLLHPHLEAFIRQARGLLPEEAWVGFQTNGLLLDERRAASLVEAGLDRVCLSLDAVSHDSFRAIREGGEVRDVQSAFSALRRVRGRHRKNDLKVGIEFVLMRDNLEELPEALLWAAREGANFALVTQLLPYDRSMAAQAAYDTNTAGAIAVYRRWKARARAEGVDIGRYFETFMKYAKTGEDEKILGFVERMVDDAAAEGIALHLERLLLRDEDWFAKVDDVFAEARLIAEREGVALTLPETAPKNTRRCEFVEENSAFVSWEGDVHPCYFLWHRYRCYVGGWEKRVRPWTFGNLDERGMLAIWDDTSYRSFREGVLRYRFPFCFDCSFALCDYVDGEAFEQDCHIESVPCGACLWCTGLFQCLQ
jgi:putative metalloenzyme radical SAM/SPASM domain maturase